MVSVRINIINNSVTDVVRDNRISLKAKGIYALAADMQRVKQECFMDDISHHCKEGDRAIHTGLEELEIYGYVSCSN